MDFQSQKLHGAVRMAEKLLLETVHMEKPKVNKAKKYYSFHAVASIVRIFKMKKFLIWWIALAVEGEMLWLTKITRSEMGIYLCIASNQVPPSVSKRIKLQIHCEYSKLK